MAFAVPRLNYSQILLDPGQISGIGDALIEGLDRRRKLRQDKQAGDDFSAWADSIYDGMPLSGGAGATTSSRPGGSGTRALDMLADNQIRGRIDQAFGDAGEPPRQNYAAALGLADAPERFRAAYTSAGERYGVDPALLVRQGKQESNFDPRAVSPAGARGISQFMPATAAEYGVDVDDPMSSIDGQARYMAQLEGQFGDNSGLALAAYNAGPGRVRQWLEAGGDPSRLPPETRAYVERVSGKPIEQWVGAGTSSAPVAPQQAGANGSRGGMTINGVALPPREVMMSMLQNPQTRPIAAQILSAAQQDRTHELPADAQEYLFAIRNGFSGDYPSWVQTKAGASRAPAGPPSGYVRGADGRLTYDPGGPADPEVIRRNQDARSPAGSATGGTGNAALDRNLAREDARAITTYREDANAARGAISDIAQMRNLRTGVDYEGGVMPGARARFGAYFGEGSGQALQSKATELQLAFTNRTKGAISDREMSLFSGATPGLQMTDDAATSVLNGMEAASQRTVEQANFMESWLDENGSLMGAQAAWDRYVDENPIIKAGANGAITVDRKNVGNWGRYVRTGTPVPDAASPAAGATVEIEGRTYTIGPDGEVYE